MKFSGRHLFNLVLVGILGAYVVIALGYNRQARMMPLMVSIPILILAIWQTVSDFRLSIRRVSEGTDSIPKAQEPGTKRMAKELKVCLWVVAMFISLYLFGFILTTSFYTFLSLKVRSGFTWRSSLGVSIGCLAFLYLIMIYGLRVDLYQGIVVLALRKAFYGY
jgi:hypothetical protein